MEFRIWTIVNAQWEELPCAAEFEVGDGTFGYGAYTVVSLIAQLLEVNPDINLHPTLFHLGQPFPNPFNMKVTFEYQLAVRESAVFTIYGITGEEVYRTTLMGAGQFQWDGRTAVGTPVSSGSYLAVLRSGNNLVERLLTIIK